MSGNKTHEHQVRQFEQGQESQDWREGAERPQASKSAARVGDERQTGNPNAAHLNRESEHNKHNDPGQEGHGRQKHSPAQEKQIPDT